MRYPVKTWTREGARKWAGQCWRASYDIFFVFFPLSCASLLPFFLPVIFLFIPTETGLSRYGVVWMVLCSIRDSQGTIATTCLALCSNQRAWCSSRCTMLTYNKCNWRIKIKKKIRAFRVQNSWELRGELFLFYDELFLNVRSLFFLGRFRFHYEIF